MSLASLPPGTDLSKIPLMPNPSGAPPNFVDPPNRTSLAMGVGLPLVIISSICLVFRLVSNCKNTRKRSLALDDYICIVAYVAMTAYFSVGMSMRHINRHSWDIPLSFFNADFAKKTFFFNLLGPPSIILPKIAIIALFLRLFKIERWVRWIAYPTVLINAGFAIGQCTVVLVGCTPQHGVWTIRSECGRWLTKIAVSGGAIGVATDLIILGLPLPIIYKLQLEPKKKLGLFVVFTMGILATICSIVSLHYRIEFGTTNDVFWLTPILQACAFAEGYISIIVACAPAIYSFSSNQIAKSDFFASLRSTFSRSTVSKSDRSQSSASDQSDSNSSAPDLTRPSNYHVTVVPMDEGLKRGSISFTEIPYQPGIRATTTIDQVIGTQKEKEPAAWV